MVKKKQIINYLILGAGPAGLTFASRLQERGEHSFLVLEKESTPGGLCRSEKVDGAPLDIGGGHFLDVKDKAVLEFVFKYLPENNWNLFHRKSTIRLAQGEIDFPIESNLWQLPVIDSLKYLVSLTMADANKGYKPPQTFYRWLYWKYGRKIAEEYLIPYNSKLFGVPLQEIGTAWLHKLPNISYAHSLISCLIRRPLGNIPHHAKFLYPKKHGYGEVWQRMADALTGKIIFNTPATHLDCTRQVVNKKYFAKHIIVTIPWGELTDITGAAPDILDSIKELRHSSLDITYHNERYSSKAHWTYIPDPLIEHHRVIYRDNFCKKAKGYWTETNSLRKTKSSCWSHSNTYAYPLSTVGVSTTIKKIITFFRAKNIYGLGRWGEWEQLNSDAVISRAIKLADTLLKQKRQGAKK